MLEVVLPFDATVFEVRLFGNREPADGSDFLTGRIQLFDAFDSLVFDSGELGLPAPDRDRVVAVSEAAGVRKVQFLGITFEGATPGLAEIEVVGPLIPPGN